MIVHTEQKLDQFFLRFHKRQMASQIPYLEPFDPVKMIYYLKEGAVRSYAISEEGFEFTIHIFMPGSFFPLTGALSNATNRYYYETMTPSTIYEAPKEEVIAFLKSEPEVMYTLTERLLRGIDKLTSRMEQLAFAKATARFASSLLYFARHFGKEHQGGIKILHKFTHKDIAAFAATTRETASREWEKLQKAGIASLDGGEIVIHNLAELESRAGVSR